MASLTETAYYARKGIITSALVLFSAIVLYVGTTTFIAYWKKTHPPPPAPPNVYFGLLPKVEFPKEIIPENLTIKMETKTGSLPQASSSARVYFMPKTSPTFFGPEKARNQAKLMGFTSQPLILSKDLYQWIDTALPLRKLTMNVINFNLFLNYNVSGDINLLKQENIPDKSQAQELSQSILSQYDLIPPDLKYPPQVTYLTWNKGNFLPTESLTEANFVKIFYARANTSEGPFVYPDNLALIKMILSASSDQSKKVILLEYNYNLIDYDIYATYPLKSIQQAFNELEQKKAYFNNFQSQNATVRDIYLAYYEQLADQTFVQPVFVFTGDDDFKAYVPAISSDWVKN